MTNDIIIRGAQGAGKSKAARLLVDKHCSEKSIGRAKVLEFDSLLPVRRLVNRLDGYSTRIVVFDGGINSEEGLKTAQMAVRHYREQSGREVLAIYCVTEDRPNLKITGIGWCELAALFAQGRKNFEAAHAEKVNAMVGEIKEALKDNHFKGATAKKEPAGAHAPFAGARLAPLLRLGILVKTDVKSFGVNYLKRFRAVSGDDVYQLLCDAAVDFDGTVAQQQSKIQALKDIAAVAEDEKQAQREKIKANNEFAELVEPVMKYLAGMHPHTKVIIEVDRAELVEVNRGYATKRFIQN